MPETAEKLFPWSVGETLEPPLAGDSFRRRIQDLAPSRVDLHAASPGVGLKDGYREEGSQPAGLFGSQRSFPHVRHGNPRVDPALLSKKIGLGGTLSQGEMDWFFAFSSPSPVVHAREA
jgi:hypothetical protein